MADLEAQTAAAAIFRKANRPVTLKFEDVVYKIKSSKGPLQRKKSSTSSSPPQEREILKGITGIVNPGEILAMMGPSGSGKTTLLTALGGRLGGNLSGTISYNNKPFSNQTKRSIGFVTQDDVLYAHLTVRETLVYTALLRLPNTLTTEEKVQHAEAIITQLGLGRCGNSIVGGPFLRGISGGERKRVSIGQEMLINPSLLFLDEPTSGLDSTTAQRIVSELGHLAEDGRTIAMTIHQPSSRLFYMFHKVLLLSEGNAVYFGRGVDVMEYFESVGYAPSVAMNPADFLLDLANGISPDESENQSVVKQTLVTSYKTNLASKVKAQLHELDHDASNGCGWADGNAMRKEGSKWATTWAQQFKVLLRRGLKERRHESFSTIKIVQVLIVALLSGLIWWHSPTSHIQDQIGLLFFYSGFWSFFPLFQAIFTFPLERMMLEKERASGMYRLSSYFLARMVGDLPMELVLPTVFVTISYWMAGLKPTAGAFIETLCVLLLNVLVSQGLGLALGTLVMDQKKATVLGSVLMLTFLLAAGYYVQHVPIFIAWIKYLSISNYTYKLLIGAQYKLRQTYICGPNHKTCLVEDYPPIRAIGLEGHINSTIALVIMFVGYRLLAYIALMRIGETSNVLLSSITTGILCCRTT